MKTGIVDVGGGLRGVYAAGIFDYCLDENIQFDLCIGVSAGSANVSSYIAGQKKRNYMFYTEYPFRKEYMGLRNFIFRKSYLGEGTSAIPAHWRLFLPGKIPHYRLSDL